MISDIARKIFGSRNQRLIKQYRKVVAKIEELEPQFIALQDSELSEYTAKLKLQYSQGTSLHALLPQAFALVREAAKRTLGMRHYPMQLIGGMALFDGKIAEMRTGEGKTLVATLPAYLGALAGKGVHLVTVNDYLAERDAKWMMPVYQILGLSVGIIKNGMERAEKKTAYAMDITYGTNNEYGFDYLRDNMAFSLEEKMQRPLAYAIVDEVDSIFIDEARTPLIISGADHDSSDLYVKMNSIVAKLTPQQEKDGPGDYTIDEKARQVYLTEDGHQNIEKILVKAGLLSDVESLYDLQNISLMHHVNAALRARALYQVDVDYIVKNGEVVIVDEHTGRTMSGRRWSDGLHQAVEAKENVKIQSENQTIASITFQNYFRLYEKIAGMTGTADTEAYEMQQIYGLEVVVIPTNKPSQRKDLADVIYLTAEEKFEAIIEDIQDCVARKQPVLVGTISIEISEFLSKKLKNLQIKHNVLNAKLYAKEAEIIAEAGRPGAVTIATNMAGRGTDIVLGGSLEAELHNAQPEDISEIKAQWQERHQEVLKAGGLHIIGTERHESRRIDNQLRGRAGRQGDVGSTRFYLSIKDTLMRRFISDNVSNLLMKMGLQKGEAITATLITKAVENAQRKVEGQNFDIRKQLLEYDNVANDQRKVIYSKRDELISNDDLASTVKEMREKVLREIIEQYIPPKSVFEMWDLSGLELCLQKDFALNIDLQDWLNNQKVMHPEALLNQILQRMDESYHAKELLAGVDNMRHLEKVIMLSVLDNHWKEHLAMMEYIRQNIHLRGYAQKDPKQEYKREAFELFVQMLDSIEREVISVLSITQIKSSVDVEALDEQMLKENDNLEYSHTDINSSTIKEVQIEPVLRPILRDVKKIGRNESCPCGSGKKYKVCHGNVAAEITQD
jgi:preprotein translocase subunit SecA